MQCVHCGQENLEKALICYWCGHNPTTGEEPYSALSVSSTAYGEDLPIPELTLPAPIEVPAPMPVPSVEFELDAVSHAVLPMPELPTIEIPTAPDIPEQDAFTVERRRTRHRPIVRAVGPGRSIETRPLIPGLGRLLIFVGGLGLLFVLGSAMVAAVGAASLGSAFCLVGLLGLAVVLWGGVLLARTGRQVLERAGAVYERLEVLGRPLREVAPGVVQELPVNLPRSLGLLNTPVAYSELRALSSQESESPQESAADMIIGAIAALVGRDEVVLARRTYPVESRGMFVRSKSSVVNQPVLVRRRLYVGPGELEQRIAETLRTDQGITVEELVYNLIDSAAGPRAQQVVAMVNQALTENPPDLEHLSSPDETLAEFERFREALRRADPELYELLASEVRNSLRLAVQRAVPSSVLDMARYGSKTETPARKS
jgi:hypothetical protein